MDLNEVIFYILAGLFTFAFIVQAIYYTFIYTRLINHRTFSENTIELPVTVIICARNEAENLEKNLPAILEQNYPEYEVIVVNDGSTDETEDILIRFETKYKHLITRKIPAKSKNFHKGKKLALTIAIKAAKYNQMLFTDADCKPLCSEWIRSMSAKFSNKSELVLGYGKYAKRKGFLNKIIRYDTFFNAMQYLSFSIKGVTYMGVGRNLAYTKTLFNKNKGFASHYYIPYGDDDLFVNEVANKNNTSINIDVESFTESIPVTSFKNWLNQKRRHISASKFYKRKYKLYLSIEPVSRILLICLIIPITFISEYYYLFIGAIIVRFVIQAFIFKYNMKRLREEDLLLSSLLIDMLIPLIYFGIHIKNLFSPKSVKWK